MKNLNGNYCVEVKDKRCRVHPNENIILRLRDLPKSLGTKYQVQFFFNLKELNLVKMLKV